ncbi:MAG: methyltransferase domain-containing protein [Cyclobacteriaceae bacterium]
MSSEYKKSIQTYYDECNRDYEIVWQLRDSLALHYGYWDETTLTHRQALWNANYQIARHAQINSSDYVLDAGCGVGGTCFFLANTIGCKVHGISLTPTQVDQAVSTKAEFDEKNLTGFSCQDYCKTNFPDNTFDAILAIESAMYAMPKNSFLEECFRILKPGGRLVVADYFLRKTQHEREQKTLNKWAKSWVIKEFILEYDYLEDLEKLGYLNYSLMDISNQVLPSIKLMHRSYYPGILISRVSNFFGRRTDYQVENSKSGRYQFQSFRQGVWRYKYLKAFKPPINADTKTDEDRNHKLDIKQYIDDESFAARFPILSKNGLSLRNLIKRIMHFYLESRIRDNRLWF